MTITEIIHGIINARDKIRNKMISAGQATSSDSLSTLADNLTITTDGGGTDTSDATAAAGDILNGKIAYVKGNKVTGTISSKSAQTYTPGTSNQTISSGQYLSGAQTIKGDSNLTSANIKSGISIFGISGSYSGTTTTDATAVVADILSGKTAYVNGSKISGSMINNGTVSPIALNAGGSYTIPKGYHSGSGKVTAATLSSQTTGTATASDILSGKTAYVNGSKIIGNITVRSQSNETLTSSKTYNAGYYPNSFTITPKSSLSRTLVWTNPYPNSDFNYQAITLSKSVSTSGEYLLIFYKDDKTSSSASRHSIVWARATYSSCIDTRLYEGTGSNGSYTGFFARNFYLSGANTIVFNSCIETIVFANENYIALVANDYCIPYKIYALGTHVF